MGARSYIVRGKGDPESFCSCSHGAGRKMSRGEAKRTFTLEDHAKAAAGVELQAAAIEAVQAGVLLPRLRDAVAVVLELQRDADQRIAAERARMT